MQMTLTACLRLHWDPCLQKPRANQGHSASLASRGLMCWYGSIWTGLLGIWASCWTSRHLVGLLGILLGIWASCLSGHLAGQLGILFVWASCSSGHLARYLGILFVWASCFKIFWKILKYNLEIFWKFWNFEKIKILKFFKKFFKILSFLKCS